MNIGILQCDEVRAELRDRFGDYPAMFESALGRVRPDWTYRTYRCFEGEFPASIDECDAYITTGSRYSVYDDTGWIRALESLVRELADSGQTYVGICFGHQMLAQALGGRVEKAASGWGVGVATTRLERRRPWLDAVQDTVRLVVSHQDQVVVVPPGLEVLGGSEFCPVYWSRYGDHMIGIQGHPEFSREYSRALLEMRRGIVGEATYQAAIRSLAEKPDDDEVFEAIARFIETSLARRLEAGRRQQA